MAIGARGEARLAVDGREVGVLLTNRAIASAEAAIGRSVLEIARAAQAGTFGMTEVARLLQAGMEASRRDEGRSGRRVTLEEAFEVMDAVGFTETARVMMEALAAVLNYRPGRDEDRPPEEGGGRPPRQSAPAGTGTSC